MLLNYNQFNSVLILSRLQLLKLQNNKSMVQAKPYLKIALSTFAYKFKNNKLRLKKIHLKKGFRILILIQISLMSQASILSGQDIKKDSLEIKVVRIYTIDDEQYKGEIISQNNQKIVLKTRRGNQEISMVNVNYIEGLNSPRSYDSTDFLRSRYAITSSAIPVKRGRGYYQNISVIYNSLGYGVTKNVSLEVGSGIPYRSRKRNSVFIPYHYRIQTGFKLSKKIYLGADFTKANIGYARTVQSSPDYNPSLVSAKTTLIFDYFHFSAGILHNFNPDSRLSTAGSFSAFLGITHNS